MNTKTLEQKGREDILEAVKRLDDAPLPHQIRYRLRETLREQVGYESPMLTQKLTLVKS